MKEKSQVLFDGNYHCGGCGKVFRLDDRVDFIKHQEECMRKPPILSDEEIGDAIDLENEYTYPRSDGTYVSTIDCRQIALAQRDDTYEKTRQETAREIITEVKEHYNWIADEVFWQSLKDKRLEVKK